MLFFILIEMWSCCTWYTCTSEQTVKLMLRFKFRLTLKVYHLSLYMPIAIRSLYHENTQENDPIS